MRLLGVVARRSVVLALVLGSIAGASCGPEVEERVDREAVCSAWCELRMDPECARPSIVLTDLQDCNTKCVEASSWGPCESEREGQLTCETDLECDGMRWLYDGGYRESECWDRMIEYSACLAGKQLDREEG